MRLRSEMENIHIYIYVNDNIALGIHIKGKDAAWSYSRASRDTNIIEKKDE
jgi:hypothetical protein